MEIHLYIHVRASELKWNTFRKFGAIARIEEADPLWKALGKVSIFLWLFGVIRLRLFRVICRCIESAFRACASPLNWNSLMKADESSTSDKINLRLWLHNNWKTWLTARCSQQNHVVGKTVSNANTGQRYLVLSCSCVRSHVFPGSAILYCLSTRVLDLPIKLLAWWQRPAEFTS